MCIRDSYARVETERSYHPEDEEVKQGIARIGDPKPGLNLHVHVIVSRKDVYKRQVQNPFQFNIIHYCFNKYTNYQTFIILPSFYIPQKSVELSHTL